MRPREIVKAYLHASCRFLLLWFGSMVVGFPLVVSLLGFKQREGFSFLSAHPGFLIVLCAMPFVGIILALGSMLTENARGQSAKRMGRCPKCGYDLTGNMSGTCPECGNAVPK